MQNGKEGTALLAFGRLKLLADVQNIQKSVGLQAPH